MLNIFLRLPLLKMLNRNRLILQAHKKKMEKKLIEKKIETADLTLKREKIFEQIKKVKPEKQESSTDLFDDLKHWCRNEILRPVDIRYIMKKKRGYGDSKEKSENIVMSEINQEIILAIEKDEVSCMLFPPHSKIDVFGKKNPVEAEALIGEYKLPIKILESKKGVSIKVHFADWLINDFDIGPISRRGRTGEIFHWDSFLDLFNDSIYWIETLRNEAQTYENDFWLAKDIAKTGVYAQNPHHIRSWWRAIEGSIQTPEGEILFIPMIEHPKSREDLKKIGRLINDFGFLKQTDRIWEAANEVQLMRY